jgi:hypothetical protein
MARPRRELWGETLREVGVLLLVFAPLDAVLKQSGKSIWETVTAWPVMFFSLAGLVAILWGIRLESEITLKGKRK